MLCKAPLPSAAVYKFKFVFSLPMIARRVIARGARLCTERTRARVFSTFIEIVNLQMAFDLICTLHEINLFPAHHKH